MQARHARSAIAVSWLPPSVDLAAMVLQADFEAEAHRHKQRERWEQEQRQPHQKQARQAGSDGDEAAAEEPSTASGRPPEQDAWSVIDIELP